MKRTLSGLILVFFLGTFFLLLTQSAQARENFLTKKKDAFSDVPRSHWAYKSIEHLRRRGLLNGRRRGRFDGRSSFSRYEMAVIVARYLQKTDQKAEKMRLSFADKKELAKLSQEFTGELSMLGQRFDKLARDLTVTKRVLGNVIATTAVNKVNITKLKDKDSELEERIAALERTVMPAVASAPLPSASRNKFYRGGTRPLDKDDVLYIRRLVRKALRDERVGD